MATSCSFCHKRIFLWPQFKEFIKNLVNIKCHFVYSICLSAMLIRATNMCTCNLYFG